MAEIKQKILVAIIILGMFVFSVIFAYLLYLCIEFFVDPLKGPLVIPSFGDSGFRALVAGCVIGILSGLVIGHITRKEA
jgi:hypothetical protein